jgi:hypothetical protein
MTHDVKINASDTIGIKKAEATARDTVEVTFKDKLSDFEESDLELILVTKVDDEEVKKFYKSSDIAGVDTKEDKDGNTVAVFTLDDDEDNLLPWYLSDKKDGEAVLIVTIKDGVSESENRYGKKLTPKDSVYAADKIKPELYDDGDDSEDACDVGDYLNYAFDEDEGTVTFYVYFTEDMECTRGDDVDYVGADLLIYYDDYEDGTEPLINGTHYEVKDIEGNMITIELKLAEFVEGEDVDEGTKYEDTDADFEIELVSNPRYLTDKSGNKPDPEEFGTFDVENIKFSFTVSEEDGE